MAESWRAFGHCMARREEEEVGVGGWVMGREQEGGRRGCPVILKTGAFEK